MTMKRYQLWDFFDCERETGYARHSLRKYYRLGKFIEPAKIVGGVYLFDASRVLDWRRQHIAKRAPTGSPPPSQSARKRGR